MLSTHSRTDCHKADQDAMLCSHLVPFYPFKQVSYILLCGVCQELPLFAWTICATTTHKSPGQDNGNMEIEQTAVHDKREEKSCCLETKTYCHFCQISTKSFFTAYGHKSPEGNSTGRQLDISVSSIPLSPFFTSRSISFSPLAITITQPCDHPCKRQQRQEFDLMMISQWTQLWSHSMSSLWYHCDISKNSHHILVMLLSSDLTLWHSADICTGHHSWWMIVKTGSIIES